MESSGGGHSAEELKFIVSTSRHEGHLLDFEEATIQHILDLQNYSAREIMVARNDIVSISVDAPLDLVLRSLIDHQYSGFLFTRKAREHCWGGSLQRPDADLGGAEDRH